MATKNSRKKHLPTPKEIKAYLDQYVIGQEETKKIDEQHQQRRALMKDTYGNKG